jgi:protein gp37
MGLRTKILWTATFLPDGTVRPGHTWNPWRGCAKVSPGCAWCYMFRQQRAYGRDPAVVVRAAPATFGAPLRWRAPARVFTCSWSDFFHPAADGWRPAAWDVIRRTPHLTYQILTKRPERAREGLPPDWGAGYPNVWLGVSVELQRWAEVRVPVLTALPARVRFLSCEPLLGPLDLRPWLGDAGDGPDPEPGPTAAPPRTSPPGPGAAPGAGGIGWVIAGGESGGPPDRRLVEPPASAGLPWRPTPRGLGWVRALRDQCRAAGVPFFFKQFGGPRPDSGGRTLDGRTWEEFPEGGDPPEDVSGKAHR